MVNNSIQGMSMLKITALMCSISVTILFLAGCARDLQVSEVLQQPLGSKLYTKCNLWYQNPDDMSAMNIQKGKFIPFGTPIEVIKANRYKLVFKDMQGVEYRIKYERELMMDTMQMFLRQIISIQDKKELIKDIAPDVVSKIEKGIVTPGMSRREVLLAYGKPPTFRTPTLDNSTWVYWIDEDSTIRVVFRADKVKVILNIND
jgi:hypothetical protein